MFSKAREYFETESKHRRLHDGIEFTSRLAEKIEPALPAGWEVRFEQGWGEFGGILVCPEKWDEVSMDEFGLAKKVVEIAIGQALKTVPWVEEDKLFCLHADAYIPVKGFYSGAIKLEVRVFKVKDCKLEYETKTVTVAKVPGGCLGAAGVSI